MISKTLITYEINDYFLYQVPNSGTLPYSIEGIDMFLNK